MDTQLLLTILIPTTTTILLLLLILHRHYLRKPSLPLPPGPRGLPILGNILNMGPFPHQALHALSKVYGPIMHIRMGSTPTIVVSSSSSAELFLKTHDAPFANRPPTEMFRIFSYNYKSFAFTEGGPYWRHIRKLCVAHLLSAANIASLRSSRKEEVDLLVEQLNSKAVLHEKVNVSEVLEVLVADIVCKMVLGRKCMTDNEDGRKFREKTRDLMGMLGAFNVNDLIPALGFLDLQGMRRRMKAAHADCNAFLERIIDEHLVEGRKKKDEGDEKDFVEVMLGFVKAGVEVEGVKFDWTIIKAIVLDMLEAAMDTMRTPIEWAISELIRNPRIMKKVQDEVESVVGLGRLVEEADLAKLQYLSMVIKETLRMHPLAPFIFHYGKEECEVGGFRIPKEANVIVNLWSLGQDPNVWPDVKEFKPERFIDNGVQYRGNDYRLLSFGTGRRMCAGMQLALVVVPLVIARLVHCFDWELPGDMAGSNLNMTEAYGFTMPRAEHLWAIPTKRLHI